MSYQWDGLQFFPLNDWHRFTRDATDHGSQVRICPFPAIARLGGNPGTGIKTVCKVDQP